MGCGADCMSRPSSSQGELAVIARLTLHNNDSVRINQPGAPTAELQRTKRINTVGDPADKTFFFFAEVHRKSFRTTRTSSWTFVKVLTLKVRVSCSPSTSLRWPGGLSGSGSMWMPGYGGTRPDGTLQASSTTCSQRLTYKSFSSLALYRSSLAGE